MQLKKELEKWTREDTKYITRFYLIMNHSEKENIELRFKYEKEDVVIQRKVNAGIGINENLSVDTLYSFLNDYSERFHKLIADHIEENWEQKIFADNPNRNDVFDIAYYSNEVDNNQGGAKINRKLVITEGKRSENQILSINGDVNLEAKKGNMSIIGWSHQ